MKLKHLLLTALCAVMSVGAWATDLTTMVGQVGATNNTSNAFADHSMNVVIKEGETYVYHLTNYNDGGNFYNNWIFEAFNSQNKYIDFRADGGHWGEAGVRAFSGSNNESVANWMTEYNGATATITIVYNAGTLTVTNNSILSGGAEYNNVLTTTGLSGDLTMRFTNEKSHQIIDKVVYTNTKGVERTYTVATLNHTAAVQSGSNAAGSTLDAETHYYNNWGTSGYAAQGYIGFSYEIPEGATVTSANLKFYSNCGGNRDDRVVQVYALNGSESSSFNWDVLSTSNVRGTLVGSQTDRRTIQEKSFDATSVVSANASDGAIVFQLGGAAAGATLYGKASTTQPVPVLLYEYVIAPTYTATFTEGNGLTPTVKIYSNSERTVEVNNGALMDETTYYYRASLFGCYDYDGQFTVNGANPSVIYTMTEIPMFTVTVNAVDGSSNVIKTLMTIENCYEGLNISYCYPKYITDNEGNVTYSRADYGKVYTTAVSATPIAVEYNAFAGTGLYVEAEDVISATGISQDNYSMGNAVRGFTNERNVLTIAETGVYDLTYAVCTNNTKYETYVYVYVNDTEIDSWNAQHSYNYIKTTGTKTLSGVVLVAGDVIKVKGGSTNLILDYVLAVKTGDANATCTLGSYGYATFSAPYALDLDGITEGFTAYQATTIEDETVTLESVSGTVAANTGLVIKGAAGTCTIPVAASGTALNDNKLVAVTANNTEITAGNYVLGVDGDAVKFLLIEGQTATLNAGKSYLAAAGGSANLRFVFVDSETGIAETMTSVQNGVAYNLNGQRVNANQKGIVIINGKKIYNK